MDCRRVSLKNNIILDNERLYSHIFLHIQPQHEYGFLIGCTSVTFIKENIFLNVTNACIIVMCSNRRHLEDQQVAAAAVQPLLS